VSTQQSTWHSCRRRKGLPSPARAYAPPSLERKDAQSLSASLHPARPASEPDSRALPLSSPARAQHRLLIWLCCCLLPGRKLFTWLVLLLLPDSTLQ
jgi:hypothetical protein